MNRLIEHLRRSSLSTGAERTDGELLDSFLGRDDGAALEALIRRHGPMVWGVCRRVLRGHQDAEDAFQATFLVLVQKAATLPDRATVGNWLYGVAHQTAVRMRAIAIRRGRRERQVTVMPEPTTADEYLWNDLRPVLDEELSRLPKKYRLLIVLCDLEGRTRREVALHLAIPEGTVASRLATAREMLAKRLSGRGVVLSGSLLGTVLSTHATSAGVPAAVVSATARTATLVTAGAGTGAIPPTVSVLITGVTNAMLMTKLKTALSAVLVLGVLATCGTALTYRAAVGQDGKRPGPEKAERPMDPPAEQQPKVKEAVMAWGKEADGLQAGIGYRGETRVFRTGETVSLVVRVRNVGKAKAKYSYRPDLFHEHPPGVTGGDGKPVLVEGTPDVLQGLQRTVAIEVSPGETVELCEMKLALRPATAAGEPRPAWMLFGTGKFQLQYDCSPQPIGNGIPPPNLFGKLDTGKLDLVVQDPVAFTAWGKEVDGLQAGLGFRPGEQYVYHPGETVALVVRVRNVGKGKTKFSYSPGLFHEHPPITTGSDGKPVVFQVVQPPLGSIPRKLDIEQNPGMVTDLCELKLVVGPAGKYQLRYDRAPDAGEPHKVGGVFPVNLLGKLDTGKLDLVVEDRAAFTAWGEPAGGLQAGLGFRPGERRVYHPGETAKLVLRVRNVGTSESAFSYTREYYYQNPPVVTDNKGGGLKGSNEWLKPRLVDVKLKAGEEIDLCVFDVRLWSPKAEPDGSPWMLHGVGKFHLQYHKGVERPFRPLPDNGLATGKLELEVREVVGLQPPMNLPADGTGEGEPVLKVFSLRQADAAELAKVLAPLFKDAKITADPRTKSLVVEADAKTFDLLAPLLGRLDRPAEVVQEEEDIRGGRTKRKEYTPDELIRAFPRGTGGGVSFAGKDKPGGKGHVSVRFKVKVVEDSPPIKTKPDGKEWKSGHAPGDIRLRPDSNRPDDKQAFFEHKEFSVVLTARVREQLVRTGVRDFEKHFAGKTIRVTGPVAFSNLMSDVGDTLLYDLVIDDVSQFEAVE